MLRNENDPVKTFRVTFQLRAPLRPRQTIIVEARDVYEAARIVKLPHNALQPLNIKEIR